MSNSQGCSHESKGYLYLLVFTLSLLFILLLLLLLSGLQVFVCFNLFNDPFPTFVLPNKLTLLFSEIQSVREGKTGNKIQCLRVPHVPKM